MEIRTQDGQVMYEAAFRAYTLANGGPSWETTTAEVLASLGAVALLEGPQPSPTRYQTVFRDGVQEINGQWFTKYSVAEMNDETKAAADEAQAKAIRQTRDDKLAALDWTQGKDIPDSISGPAAIVRQALRDVPSQTGFPWEVTWPE